MSYNLIPNISTPKRLINAMRKSFFHYHGPQGQANNHNKDKRYYYLDDYNSNFKYFYSKFASYLAGFIEGDGTIIVPTKVVKAL
jgi:hypothetical protein